MNKEAYLWTVITCLAVTLVAVAVLYRSLNLPAKTDREKHVVALKAVVILALCTLSIIGWLVTVVKLGSLT